MHWKEVKIHTSRDAQEPVSNILYSYKINGIVIEDLLDITKEKRSLYGEIYDIPREHYPTTGIFIKAYFPDDEHLTNVLQEIKEKINRLKEININIGENKIYLNNVKEEDWETAWKKYYKPVKVSERITIVPTWEAYEAGPKEKIIELDPGMAFGTGTHPTTMLSIQAIEKYIAKDDIVLDVGCGSGILSIAAGSLGAEKIYAYDLDQVAVNSTTSNIELNQLSEKIVVQQNNLLENVSKQADIIVANILADVIVTLINDAWDNLKDNGLFITSGIIQEKEELVKNSLIEAGFIIDAVNQMDHWISIVARKNATSNVSH